MNRTLLVVLIVGASVSGVSALAHHSFPATYLVDDTMTIEGDLVAFLFKNPHSFVQVTVEDADGQIQRWAVEWSGARALVGQGVERQTLRAGDEVIITGRPSRTPGEFRVQMLTLHRPLDGFGWGDRPGEVID